MLIGRVVRDPEVKQIQSGKQLCIFTIATGRSWTTAAGERKEESEFTRIVTWDKLADICSKILNKGRLAYVEGRLSTRKFTNAEGVEKYLTEVIANEVMVLDSAPAPEETMSVPKIETTDMPF